ncbi:MAG: recombinase family protein [Eubacteriales bacterium]|nr:recombinase family protein [Eubacteriales bacterium]
MSDQKMIIGYYRLSMEDDSEGESNSIMNQRKLIKDYIAGIPELSAMPFQEYYDDGYSGSSMERPAIKQVLQLARENQVQCIVVKDFSRFARNYIEMGTYLEQIFPFLGVRFVSISDHYDSMDYRGKNSDIEVQFKGLIADFYVKDQSVKVKAAIGTKRKNGEYCCGSASYGYRINPENKKSLLIVEEEAKVIRRVFELTNQRYSKKDICRLFNEEGILTPLQSMSRRQKSDSKRASSRGLQWTSDMVRKILNDKNYIGCMVYGKTKIPEPGTGKEVPVPRCQWKIMENHHEPIVSEEIFEKAQSLQVRHARKSKFDKDITLLSGYVKCGNCRRNLTGSKKLHGHILYSCAYSQGKEDTGCFAGKADDKMLEQIVLAEIKAYLRRNISQEQMQQSMREQHEDNIQEYKLESQECENRQEEIRIQNRRNYEKYHEGQMDQKQFMEAKKQLEEEKERLQRRGQELDELINGEKEILMKKNVPVEQMLKFLGYEKLKQEMLEEYVQGIYVYDDGRVEVEWKELSKKAVRNRIEEKKDF